MPGHLNTKTNEAAKCWEVELGRAQRRESWTDASRTRALPVDCTKKSWSFLQAVLGKSNFNTMRPEASHPSCERA